ncbi:spore cortex biosynthesis protein YabQ [Cellulosilyticum sp. I15G10I2]|uniref:spore cortex biosynthesis protein YabQ n=1 Tax=Cellulosilyticum sp. I15G10I2 TaxID=1892843 RepID=UPI00085BE4FD|nr:spore cortex biosynthesis protein YabQ [Cellulosilyticum sp. I15G10I2]
MNQIVSNQSLLFITCAQIGIVMGIFFDLIRIFRKIIKHPDILVQLEDLIYWIICALIGFYMLYINNYAAIRPFVFIGILLGAILYFASFSIVFMKIATIVINYIKALIHKIIRLLLIPIKGAVRILKVPLKYASGKLSAANYYKKRRLRRLRRKWYHTKADIRTELRIKKDKK